MKSARDTFCVSIVSNLPPPVHGVSVFNELLVGELDRAGVPYRFYRVGSIESGSNLGGFGFKKLIRDAGVLLRVVFDAIRGPRGTSRVLYFTPSQGGPGVYRDFLVGAIGRLLFQRVVTHIHGCGWITIREQSGFRGRIMLNALRASDAVICLGQGFSHRMKEHTRLNCVPVNNGAPAVEGGSGKRLPIEGPIALLFLGNFLPAKGLQIAARATRILLSRRCFIVLRCAGSWRQKGDERDFVERFRPELHEGSIEILGPVSRARKEELLRAAHFMLLPTTYALEGQPLALLEALSCGVVPMTTDQGGISDLMTFPGSERLISREYLSPEDLASAIEAFIRNPEEFAVASQACHSHFERHLTFEACSQRVLSILSPPRTLEPGV